MDIAIEEEVHLSLQVGICGNTHRKGTSSSAGESQESQQPFRDNHIIDCFGRHGGGGGAVGCRIRLTGFLESGREHVDST